MQCTNAFKISYKLFLFRISAIVSAIYSSNHQPIIGFQGVQANNSNREDQVNTMRAPFYFNQVNQSLYHSTIAPQSWVNRNLHKSLSFYLSILNNNIRHEKNLLRMKMLLAQKKRGGRNAFT